MKLIDFEIKLSDDFTKIKYKCRCGHTVYISNKMDFAYCSWCGRRVFKSDLIEFRRKLLRACGKDNNEQISQQKNNDRRNTFRK